MIDAHDIAALHLREMYCAHTGFCNTDGECPKCVADPMTREIAELSRRAAEDATRAEREAIIWWFEARRMTFTAKEVRECIRARGTGGA